MSKIIVDIFLHLDFFSEFGCNIDKIWEVGSDGDIVEILSFELWFLEIKEGR